MLLHPLMHITGLILVINFIFLKCSFWVLLLWVAYNSKREMKVKEFLKKRVWLDEC